MKTEGETSWIVRRLEGLRREMFGLFTDQSTKPVLRSKRRDELQRVADAHNLTLPTPTNQPTNGEGN
jgi:hypothetical protein